MYDYSFKKLFLLLTSFLLSGLYAQKDESLLLAMDEHKGPVYAAAFSNDDKLIASGAEDKIIYLWSAETGEIVKTLTGHTGKVQFLEFSPDGKSLLSAGGTQLLLWDLESGAYRSFAGHKTHTWNARFSLDGSRFASTDLLNKFRLWDTETGEMIHSFEGHAKTVLSIAFSPDRKYIASGSLDQTIKIWDTETKEIIRSIDAHAGNIYSLDFSPDSKLLASVSLDETIKIWDVATGKIIKLLSGHQYAVMYVRFSPDGKFLISASWDKTVKLWEILTGNCIYTFIDHTDVVNVADFSHDGKHIITGSNDGKAMLWEISPRFFAEFYYWDELKAEMDQSGLFEEKQKPESRQYYEIRKDKAAQYKKDLYLKYYNKYLEKNN